MLTAWPRLWRMTGRPSARCLSSLSSLCPPGLAFELVLVCTASPFRVSLQVGCFDPYSDDPRLGIQKVALCKYTAQMVVAGTAGQVCLVSPDVAIWEAFCRKWP